MCQLVWTWITGVCVISFHMSDIKFNQCSNYAESMWINERLLFIDRMHEVIYMQYPFQFVWRFFCFFFCSRFVWHLIFDVKLLTQDLRRQAWSPFNLPHLYWNESIDCVHNVRWLPLFDEFSRFYFRGQRKIINKSLRKYGNYSNYSNESSELISHLQCCLWYSVKLEPNFQKFVNELITQFSFLVVCTSHRQWKNRFLYILESMTQRNGQNLLMFFNKLHSTRPFCVKTKEFFVCLLFD